MAPLIRLPKLPVRVLLVEREDAAASILLAVLERQEATGIHVETASELAEGLKRLSQGGIDVVLLDLDLPDSQGMATFERMNAFSPDVPIVVVTDEYDEDTGVSSVQAGAQDYLARREAEPRILRRVLRYALERHSLQAALRSLSLVDELTGLYTSRGFMHLAEQQLDLQRRMGRGVVLVRLDLDHLKTINEGLGHHVGDRALRRVANILRSTVRRSDLAARLREDDFVVLGLEAAEDGGPPIVSRLREALADFNDATRENFLLSVSLGVARSSDSGAVTLEALLADSEAALREEKRAKLNAVLR